MSAVQCGHLVKTVFCKMKWSEKMKSSTESNIMKDELLERFKDKRTMPNREEWEIIYQCAVDSDEIIRYDAAEVLGIRCNAEDEELLRQMTYDKDMMVKVSAIEALELGIQKKTLSRLYQLMRRGGQLVRSYAVSTYFEIWLNRNGYTKDSVDGFLEKIEGHYKNEKDLRVRCEYERCRYLSGKKEGIKKLKEIIYEAQNDDASTQGAAFCMLLYVRNVFNEREINHILEESEQYIIDDCTKKEMDAAQKQKEVPKVLILDRENAGLAQMLRYLGYDMKEKLDIDTQGLCPIEMTKEKVREKLDEDDSFQSYFYPRNLRMVWQYDYIVPLGIKLNQEKYPFQKVVPLFEEVSEYMLDIEKAKQMLKELEGYIDNDLKNMSK